MTKIANVICIAYKEAVPRICMKNNSQSLLIILLFYTVYRKLTQTLEQCSYKKPWRKKLQQKRQMLQKDRGHFFANITVICKI